MNFARHVATLCLAVISITATAADYTSIDIDTNGLEGSTTTVGDDGLDITGAGADIWDTSDHFRFVYQTFSGDFVLRCRVADLQVTDPWSKAGVMIRASTDANSVHASMFVSGQNGFSFQHRDATGGGSAHTSGYANQLPNSWVKIVKVGSVVTGFRSDDGIIWYSVASTNWFSADPVLIGFAVTSHNASLLCSAQIRDISLQAPQGPVNGYTSVDVNTGPEGSTEAAGSDGFNIAGSGSDIWNNWDGFRLVYKSYSGNFDVRARVSSIENTDGWAKAGVTVRASTSPDSMHTSMFATSSNGFAFQYRDQTGGSSSHVGGGATASPNSWVRLIRSGNVVTGYRSTDNVIWEKVASTTWGGPDNVLVGMAVTAHNYSALCHAEFRDVSIQPYTVPAVGTGDGLAVSYYNGIELSGSITASRVDPTVDSMLNGIPSGLSDNNYSTRWIGRIQPQYSESYTFYTLSDDGIRLWVNGQLLINNWTYHAPTWDVGSITLTGGQKYDIMVEYFQSWGGAVAKLMWSSASTPMDVVPQSQLYSTGNNSIGTGTGLFAQYFNSNDLSSPVSPFNVPVLTRVDGPIGFDWGGGSPAAVVNVDNFSVRWIGEIQPQYTETTTFYVTADDGVRFWLGNKLLIDQWKDQPPTTYTATVDLKAGEKIGVKIEYYERGGGAVAKLEWSSASRPRTVVPGSQLYYQSGLYASIPTYSVTSPAFIEGTAWSPNSTAVTVTGNGVPATFISENNWYVDVPLNANTMTTLVSISNIVTNTIQSAPLIWWPLDISGVEGSNENIVIRKGDSLLLTATGNGAILTIDADGDNVTDLVGAPSQKFPYQYNTAGTYIAEARIDGVSVGTLVVTVMDIDLLKPIAGEIGFERIKNVVITPASVAYNVEFGVGDEVSLDTSVVGPFSNEDGEGTTIHLTTKKRGTPVLTARIGGSSGPILASKVVDEFTIERRAMLSAIVNAKTNMGATVLKMNPYIPKIRYQFQMFAHTATFSGGSTNFSCHTSDVHSDSEHVFKQVYDEIKDEMAAEIVIGVEVPNGEDKYCFRSNAFQASSAEQQVAADSNSNGCICWGTVNDLTICMPDQLFGELQVILVQLPKEGSDGSECDVEGPYFISLSNDHAGFTNREGDVFSIRCDDSTEVQVGALSPGRTDVFVGGATFENAITIMRLTITPTEKTVCKGESVTFTAEGEPAGGGYIWSAPGGDPDNGIDASFTTKYDAKGIKTLTVLYTLDDRGPATCTKTVTAKVVVIGSISHNGPVCKGDPLTFTATADPAVGFPTDQPQWEVEVGDVVPLQGNGTSFTVTPAANYVGPVKVKAKCGDSELTSSTNVVYPEKLHVFDESVGDFLPALGPVTVCRGETLDFLLTFLPPGASAPEDTEWRVDGNFYAKGVDAVTVAFNTTSTTVTDYRIVSVVACGKTFEAQVLVVEIDKIEGPDIICRYDTASFTAIAKPAGAHFPFGRPMWGGVVTNQPPMLSSEVVHVKFDDRSVSPTDFKIVKATCGNTVDHKVIVYEVVAVEPSPSESDAEVIFTDLTDGWTVFPDARSYNTRTQGHNTVRMVAQIAPELIDIRVFVRSYDVDDPSSDTTLDPDDSGRDNRGTLNSSLDGPSDSHEPNGAGYQGQIQPLGKSVFSEGAVVEIKTDGQGRAIFDLYVTFAPGDNFRVVASCDQLELEGLSEVPRNGPVGLEHSVGSTPMYVWRYLNVEVDSMRAVTNPKPAPDHETPIGSSWALNAPIPGHSVLTTSFFIGAPDVDFYANGEIVGTAGTRFKVVANSASLFLSDTIEIVGVPTPAQQAEFVSKIFDIYDDDETLLPASWTPLLPRYNLIGTVAISKYEPAYIQLRDVQNENPNKLVAFALYDDIESSSTVLDDSKDLTSSDMYWTHLLVAAYQLSDKTDQDPDKDAAELGSTLDSIGTSGIYLEAIRETIKALPLTPTLLQNEVEGTVAHEIGHQPGGQNDHVEGGLMGAGTTSGSFSAKTLKRFRITKNWYDH